jgi:hypothetical protein
VAARGRELSGCLRKRHHMSSGGSRRIRWACRTEPGYPRTTGSRAVDRSQVLAPGLRVTVEGHGPMTTGSLVRYQRAVGDADGDSILTRRSGASFSSNIDPNGLNADFAATGDVARQAATTKFSPLPRWTGDFRSRVQRGTTGHGKSYEAQLVPASHVFVVAKSNRPASSLLCCRAP